ncbi:MAG: c-type cytochrome [Acidobacteria bacterium]|nr:c-type cytochrome [Acidobacteriota bacterium]MCL5286373.1 c-type cytochrome [Acidobacteriota bacterium]
MRRLAAILCLFLLVVAAGLAQQTQEKKEPVPAQAPANLVIPPEEAKRENPVKPTEASIADGKKMFGYQCAMCHGEKGDGKSELGETMKLTMKDYTDPAALKEFTDGTLFYILEKGKGKMPGQEGRMSANQKWNMINYIRALAKKSAEAKTAPPPKPE